MNRTSIVVITSSIFFSFIILIFWQSFYHASSFTSKKPSKYPVTNGLSRDLSLNANIFVLKKLQSALDTVHNDTAQSLPSIDFSYIFNDMVLTINLLNFIQNLMTCEDFKQLEGFQLVETRDNSYIYKPSSKPLKFQKTSLQLETSKVDIDFLISSRCGSSTSDTSLSNKDRCFLLKNLKLLQRAFIQLQLNHLNIAPVLGICIPKSRDLHQKLSLLKSAGIVVTYESGDQFDLSAARLQSWQTRLAYCRDLLNLAIFFSNSPLGGIAVSNWKAENFLLDSQGSLKMIFIGDDVILEEPRCDDDTDCHVSAIVAGVQCVKGRCMGHNSKTNLLKLSTSLLFDLLRHPDPTTDRQLHSELVTSLAGLQLAVHEAHDLLQRLILSTNHNRPTHKPPLQSDVIIESSNQKAQEVVINDIKDLEQQPAAMWVNDVIQGHDREMNVAEMGLKNFQKFPDQDFPGKHDYYCEGSKAEWGCIHSLQTAEEGASFCLQDIKCKAFVTIPHIRKNGWFIAILKSDVSDPVHHSGITLYVKDVNGTQNEKKSTMCLKEDLEVGRESEEVLMQICGETRSEKDRIQMMSSGQVLEAQTFKPGHGEGSVGGHIVVRQSPGDGGKIFSSIFSAKKGPQEFSASQLFVYRLDRLLGIYKTLPSVERLLTSSDLEEAHFPVDVGGNKFDGFKPLKRIDGSLPGLLSPFPQFISFEHYIKVPRLDDVTAAVTRFSEKQLDDMQYLILGYLTSIPFPVKGHMSWKNNLIFIKTDNALVEDTSEYLNYFYNCQFPARLVSLLQQPFCNLFDEVSKSELNLRLPDKARARFQSNVDNFLRIVETCCIKFNKQMVLVGL